MSLPEDGCGLTTSELTSNVLDAAREGGVLCKAELTHGGRQTQVWNAVVTAEATGKTIALFRCTQMVLCPPA